MKLKELFESKKDITIAYLGDSITENRGHRNVLTSYFKETYPDNNITEINAGIGGTNSFLGVSRVERDVISKNPDIVFVEFSVNDNHNEFNPFYGRSYEGIIRKLKKYNRNLPVIAAGFTTKNMNEFFYDKGTFPYSVKIHWEICKYFKIPFVNAGEMLYKHIKANNETMLDYTTDTVHPHEKGGKFYGDAIWEAIKDYDFEFDYEEKQLFTDNLEDFTFIYPEEKEGWKKGQWESKRRPEDYIYSDTPGTEYELEFSGTAFGIYTTTEKDSGNLLFSIDGGEWEEISTWDKWALQFGRVHLYALCENLKPGKHLAKIKVSENKEEKSEGHNIRIIAFMAEKPE